MKQEAIDLLERACACQMRGCALMLLDDHLGRPATACLHESAMLAGFTEAEAYGIMDGWDGGKPLFADDAVSMAAHKEYWVGAELGRRLRARYG